MGFARVDPGFSKWGGGGGGAPMSAKASFLGGSGGMTPRNFLKI